MWARPTCGLKDERNEIDVWILVEFVLLRSLLAISPGFVVTAETRDGLQEKGATMDTSKYVTEPLRFKKRSIRACSVCPLTTRVRAGTYCSMNTMTPL